MAEEHAMTSDDRGRGPAGSDLKRNAEKALKMKRDAGPQRQTPEHQTASEGKIRGPQLGQTDKGIGREPTFEPNLKRSHNARSGDS